MSEPTFRPYVEHGPVHPPTRFPDLASFGSAAALLVSGGDVKPGATVSIYQVRRATAEEMAANIAAADASREARLAAVDVLLLALDTATDASTRAVMALHRPEGGEHSGYPDCDGDDFDGYEAERPSWPCRTVLALASVHGIPVPDVLR